jgi:2'-5' RNA ligase
LANTEFTLWLTPQEPLRTTLSAVIRRLAQDLDAAEFEPHVTLFCGRSSDEEANAIARGIAAQFPPITLSAERLAYTDRFTKTLFVQFEDSAIARRMFEAARRSYAHPSDYAFNPHLSLLYKKLPETRQRALCDTLDLPRGSYGFDRVRMIETELPIEDDGAIRRWRIVCDEPLQRHRQTIGG